MAIRRDEFDGMDSAQEFTGDTSAADMLSQYFGETPTDLPPAPEDTTALAQLRELVRMEEERRSAEAQATRPMDQPFVETVMPTDESVNLAPPPAVSGLPPGVTQADLDAIAAGFRDAGYGPNNNFLSQGIGLSGIGLGGSYMPGGPAEMTTPAINFTGDPNQPFFDMRTPEGGVDPRYFVPGLTSPSINTVGPTDRGMPQRRENECPPGLEYDYELGRCVRPDVPRTTPPPTTEPPSTTPPPTTEPPATTPPPTTASPVLPCWQLGFPRNYVRDAEGNCVDPGETTPPPTTAPPTTPPPTTRPPQTCPPGYIYNPETRQCEALITSPPPTTAPPTTPPPTTAPPTTPPPTTAPPSPTPPPTTAPPPTCPPGYERNAMGACAPIRLDPCEPGYVRSTITGRCEPITTGTPPPGTTAPPTTPPPGTTAPPTTPPPTSGCKQGEVYSTTLGKCVPITTGAPPTTAPPATTNPPPGVITKFDPSAAMLEAYRRMFGTGVVNLGGPGATTSTTTTSPLVSTTGIGTPTPGTATAGSPVPLPGFKNVTFTPGQPQFFGQTGGMLPGTMPSAYNPFSLYKGPNAVDMIGQNPNLSPTILGGLQGLGYYVDRLGNRIMSPGGGFMRFAEGGEVSQAPAQTNRYYGSFGPEVLAGADKQQRLFGVTAKKPLIDYADPFTKTLLEKVQDNPESMPESFYKGMIESQSPGLFSGIRAPAGGVYGGGTGGGLGYGGPTTHFPSALNPDRKKPTVTIEEVPGQPTVTVEELPPVGYDEGGEVDRDEVSSRSAQAELRALLDAMPAETETEVSVSPTSRTVRKTKKKAVDTGKAKGISMSLEESMASIEPPSRASARDQLAALLRRNRGLTAKTFSTPTLDRASLAARGPLATKRFQDGGEVDDSTPLQRRIYMESVSDPAKRTAPITEKSMSAKELDKLRTLIEIAEANPSLSEKTGKPLPGVVDYAHQRMLMEKVDPMGSLPISMRDSDYNALESGNLRNTLGQFTFERLPDGSLVVKDTYDYTGDVGARFNPLIQYANKVGVNRPVRIALPPKSTKKR